MSPGQPGTQNFFPINLNLQGKRVLICGGSGYALSTTETLVEFGAVVDVVSPHMVSEFSHAVVTYGERIRLERRKFDSTDEGNLADGKYTLAFAFTVSSELENAARKAKVPLYIMDRASDSDFVLPSMIKRGHMKISVSTDSISRPLEQAITQRIEAMFVSEIDSYTLFLTRMKELIAGAAQEKRFSHADSYHRLLTNLAESEEILHALQRRNFEEANHLARAVVSELETELSEPGAREE